MVSIEDLRKEGVPEGILGLISPEVLEYAGPEIMNMVGRRVAPRTDFTQKPDTPVRFAKRMAAIAKRNVINQQRGAPLIPTTTYDEYLKAHGTNNDAQREQDNVRIAQNMNQLPEKIEYWQWRMDNPEEAKAEDEASATVRCPFTREGEQLTDESQRDRTMTKADCEEARAKWMAKYHPADQFFGNVVKGITKFVDFGVNNILPIVAPGVGSVIGSVYKNLSGATNKDSEFYNPNSSFGDNLLNTGVDILTSKLKGKGSTHRLNFLKKHSLKNKGYSLKELSKISAVPLPILQEVYDRGIGAYKSNPQSVRLKGSYVKNVDAPMSKKLSKENWAMARVYSFLDGNPSHDNDLRKNKMSGGFKTFFMARRHPHKDGWVVVEYEEETDSKGNKFIKVKEVMTPTTTTLYTTEEEAKADIVKFQRKQAITAENEGVRMAYEPVIPSAYKIRDETFGKPTQEMGSRLETALPVAPLSGKTAATKELKEDAEKISAFGPTGARRGKGRFTPDDYDAMFGGGIWDIIKTGVSRIKDVVSTGIRKDYPPSTRRLLAEIGNRPIIKMYIRRDPVQSIYNTVINLVSLGKWNQLRQKYGYDKVFHLGLEFVLDASNTTALESRYVIEKNATIDLAKAKPFVKDTQIMEVPYNGGQTLNAMLAKAQRSMKGDFFTYSAFTNNCQDFILALLISSGLATNDAIKFIKQNMVEVATQLPSYLKKVAQFATDAGAVASVAIEGRGGRKSLKLSKGASPKFAKQLAKFGISQEAYLDSARQKAKAHGLAWKHLGFSDDEKHKLQIPNVEGKIIRFGAVGLGDFVLYSLSHSPTAEKSRKSYLARATKIPGDWKKDAYSPNSLAIAVLW
ncbi:MAG: hypothetical protein YSLV5_ORF11 [Yellowstone Lake virophage 5]|uniref:DUF4105 domain-containing protein n=1 Tax=Yellowstone Lake virophage 5 TaxID=1557033 RepID=A0A0A0RS01_9VIRU|nr:MAG: hypothetical protein ASQ69_gp11 [Yellowstone Lake virophage 5]AIW01869.1 MAG: hypothetical protein YSLV5_ORF11 [Yellowstone Lake virophage 5]